MSNARHAAHTHLGRLGDGAGANHQHVQDEREDSAGFGGARALTWARGLWVDKTSYSDIAEALVSRASLPPE